MSWATPTLRETRELVRGEVTAALGKASYVANSVLRVMADAQASLSHLVLRYIDWLARQLLPDTAEGDWLRRHGFIWLVNSDGSFGQKAATYAEGSVTLTGTEDTVVPLYTIFTAAYTGISYETTEIATITGASIEVPIRALTASADGNLDAGESLEMDGAIAGVDGTATVVTLTGGTDAEDDEDLRARVLRRIRQPPMGGDAADYEAWALAVPGVTRAWCAPNEMGIGTVTVRIMCDDLRATDDPLTDGFPTQDDLDAVTAYVDTQRPVAVKDWWCQAPVPEPINFTIGNLDPDTTATRTAIAASVAALLKEKARPASSANGVLLPAQTIYREWISAAILESEGVESFDLVMDDHAMPSGGSIAVMGTISYS